MDVWIFPIGAVVGYLAGSLSFAVIVSRLMGLSDPRTYGSRNPGATNVLRSGSKAAAAITLLLDAVKGWLPVWGVGFLSLPPGHDEVLQAVVGLGAFLGHLYPIFFRFQGGKGVATAVGVVLGLHWVLGLACAATWIILAFFFRYSSLASLVAAIFAPVYYTLVAGPLWNFRTPVLLALVVMAALLVHRHRENIARLLKGQESRLGAGRKT